MITLDFLSVSLLAELSRFVEARLGLYFGQDRHTDLERGLRAASVACCGEGTAAQFGERLLSGSATEAELAGLSSHLTIGETYFMREPRSLEIFETRLLPSLNKRPRIWSAGCSTGEEPCSIAMSRGVFAAARGSIILATDIDTLALQKAMRGNYGEWSFRATPQSIRNRHFAAAPNGRWTIDPAILKMIQFEHANLVETPPPAATDIDVIFCRNVLMYFSPEAARQTVRGFHRALAKGGWLIVSPAEVSAPLFVDFTLVSFEGITLYRKISPAGLVAPSALPLRPDSEPPFSGSHLQPDALPANEIAPHSGSDKPRVKPRSRVRAMLRLARWHANRGDLSRAFQWCEKIVASGHADFRTHFLRAAILEENGALERAARVLRQTLYLEPDFVIGHFALASLTARQGREQESAKHFANTLRLLAGLENGFLLPESGGITAGALRELIVRRNNG